MVNKYKGSKNMTNTQESALIELGSKLRLAWAKERQFFATHGEEESERAHAVTKACAEIVDRIGELTASTLEGFAVKALAISWCQAGELIEFHDDARDGPLAAQLVNQLLALGLVSKPLPNVNASI